MTKVLYVGLDVHKESIVAATAPAGDTAAELYGSIGGTLEALDKFIKKLAEPNLELRFVCEAGPCGYSCNATTRLASLSLFSSLAAMPLLPGVMTTFFRSPVNLKGVW